MTKLNSVPPKLVRLFWRGCREAMSVVEGVADGRACSSQ